MDLVGELARRLGVPFVERGSGLFLALADVNRILDECSKESIAILGFEGFWIQANRTIPDMEAIADFSSLTSLTWSEHVTQSIEATREVLGQLDGRGLLFELVVERRYSDDDSHL